MPIITKMPATKWPWLSLLAVLTFLAPASAGAREPESAVDAVEQVLNLPAGDSPKTETAGGTVQFIGTATVIIRYRGLVILTDPNFLHKGERVHLGYGLHSTRLTEPAIRLEDLPAVDLVLLSHLHEDHFDKRVQHGLRKDVPIVTTSDARAGLAKMGFTKIFPLTTWQSLRVTKGPDQLHITAMPGRHGSPVTAALLPDVMGSMLDFSSKEKSGARYRMYISGDTLLFDQIAQIPQRYPDIDLALLHLGGTRVLGVMKVTMDGEDGVRMLQLVVPKHAIPIHYNDYTVFKSPLSDFQKAVKAAGWEARTTYLQHGQTYSWRERATGP